MAWPCSRSCASGATAVGANHVRALLRFASDLLAAPLSGKRLLGPAPITRLEIEGMLLNILDDIFLLHLALEAT